MYVVSSKCVGCSPFLPTTQSISYIERDSQIATVKERENDERTCCREIELERDQVAERERERERA